MIESKEPLILAIETATRAGSISLSCGEKILSSLSGDPAASHSTDLLDNIHELLQTVNVKLDDVTLFAAAAGPGSFTGLRIGLATIKAFAVCLDRQCVGVPTLAAIAHAAGPSEGTVALLPAGRGELYAQLFRVDGNYTIEVLDGASHLSPSAVLAKYVNRSLKWAGEGAHLHEPFLREYASNQGIRFGEDSVGSGVHPSPDWMLAPISALLAESVAALALREYRYGRAIAASELQAAYVRASDAEIKEKWSKREHR